MPFEKGKSGNPNGRPKGRHNKVNADAEIAKALAKGMSLEDIVTMLSQKVMSEDITDVQQAKYLSMLIDLNKYLLDRELKIKTNKQVQDFATTKQKKMAEEEARKIRESRPVVVTKFNPKASG